MKSAVLWSLIILSFLSCKDGSVLVPKPRTYPRIEFPEKTYVPFGKPECPFQMRIPEYGVYLLDSLKTEHEKGFDCWFDLYYNTLNTYIHFSYVAFNTRDHFDELVVDAFEMADKHNVKASYRDEMRLFFPDKKVYGLLFEIDGPVASPIQFFLTDSTTHFLRGSLYFKDVVNRDSIQPVFEFVKEDLEVFFESFTWKG